MVDDINKKDVNSEEKHYWNYLSEIPYRIDADLRTIRINIHENFFKAIQLLIAISPEKKCKICKDISPECRTKSGLADHYFSRHRKLTAIFFRDLIMTKSPDEIEQLKQKARGDCFE